MAAAGGMPKVSSRPMLSSVWNTRRESSRPAMSPRLFTKAATSSNPPNELEVNSERSSTLLFPGR